MKSFFRLLLVVFLASCTVIPPMVTMNTLQNEDGEALYWEQQDFPLDVYVDADTTAEQHMALDEATSTWNVAVDRQVFLIHTTPIDWTSIDPYEPHEDMDIMFFSADLPPDHDGVQLNGRTLSVYEDHTLKFAATSVDSDLTGRDLVLVLIHELGHTIGLDHDQDFRSIMFPSATRSLGQLQEDDVSYVRWQVTR